MRTIAKLFALLTALLVLSNAFFAIAESSDDDWAALFSDNTWTTSAEDSSTAQDQSVSDANAFWEAVTQEETSNSVNTSSTVWSLEDTSSSSRVGELGDHSVSLGVMGGAAVLLLVTAAFARHKRTARR